LREVEAFMRSLLYLRLPIWFIVPLVALVSVFAIGVGYVAALRLTTPCTLSKAECTKMTRFYEAWQIVSTEYVDASVPTPDTLIDGAIGGMVDSLGDTGHSRYISPQDAESEREALRGSFEGIGAYLTERDGMVIIAAPIEGAPAEKAGIRSGDRILRVDGVDARSDSVTQLQSRVRGPSGTSVTLEVLHDDGSMETIQIVRATIDIPTVSWKMLPGDVAHLHFNQFSMQADDDMRQALTEITQANAKALILDLRNNPGGYVDQLMKVAAQFVPKDTVILIEEDRAGQRTPYATDRTGLAQSIPLIVLVNSNTASAGEILAGALQNAGRATIIGEPTFGTATVLRPFDLDGGASIRLGTTQWLTPDGEVVRGKGITPDTTIFLRNWSDIVSPREAAQMSDTELRDSVDSQLSAAYTAALTAQPAR
jgi:carboxyl-terminal processing protease